MFLQNDLELKASTDKMISVMVEMIAGGVVEGDYPVQFVLSKQGYKGRVNDFTEYQICYASATNNRPTKLKIRQRGEK